MLNFVDKYVLIPKTTPRWLADSCEYETGDGAGIRDELIGKTTSAEDCAAVVIEQRPLANGATWGPDVDEESARKCYAEFGATTRGNTSDCPSCRSCIFERMLILKPYYNLIQNINTIVIFKMLVFSSN